MHEVVLHFHDKKHARKLMNNLNKGKGTVVKSEHLGGSFWSNVSNAFHKVAPVVNAISHNPIVQKIGNKVLDHAIETAPMMMMGAGVEKRRGRPKKGEGFFGNVGKALKSVSSNAIVQHVGNKVLDKAVNHAVNYGLAASGAGVSNKKLKLPKGLEMYNKMYNGGSFAPL